eukprot:tig00000806_g4382.t1
MNRDSALSWTWVEDRWRQAEQESWAIGVDEFRKGNYREAIAHFQDAGGSPHVLFNMGVAHTKLREFAEAESYFTEIVRDYARDHVLAALALYMLGVVLQMQRNFHAAIQHYTRVFLEFLGERDVVELGECGLDFVMRKADLLFNRAVCLAACESFTEALQDIKYTLELLQSEIDSRAAGEPPAAGRVEKDLWASLGAAQELGRRVLLAVEERGGAQALPRNAAIDSVLQRRSSGASSGPAPPAPPAPAPAPPATATAAAIAVVRGHRLSSDSVGSAASVESPATAPALALEPSHPPSLPVTPAQGPSPARAPPALPGPGAAPASSSSAAQPPTPQPASTDSPRRQLFAHQRQLGVVAGPGPLPPPLSASSAAAHRFSERLAAAMSALASASSSPRQTASQSPHSAPSSGPSSSHSLPRPTPPPVMSLCEAAALGTPREEGPPVSTAAVLTSGIEEPSPQLQPRGRHQGVPRLNLAAIAPDELGNPVPSFASLLSRPGGTLYRPPSDRPPSSDRAAGHPPAPAPAAAIAGAAGAGRRRPGRRRGPTPPSALASASPGSSFSASEPSSAGRTHAHAYSRPADPSSARSLGLETLSARSLEAAPAPPTTTLGTPRDERPFTDMFRPRKSPLRVSGSGVVRVPGGTIGLEELHAPPDLALP